jgi:hypothetical protein
MTEIIAPIISVLVATLFAFVAGFEAGRNRNFLHYTVSNKRFIEPMLRDLDSRKN